MPQGTFDLTFHLNGVVSPRDLSYEDGCDYA